MTGLQTASYNGIYSSTGLHDGRDYYVKENGYGYLYFRATTNKGRIKVNFTKLDSKIILPSKILPTGW